LTHPAPSIFMNRVIFWAGMLLVSAVIARGAPPLPLLPMQEGNYWILKSSLGDQKVIRCEPGTNQLLQVTGLSERPVLFYGSKQSAMLYYLDTVKGKLRPIVSLQPSKKRRSAFSVGKHPCDQLLVALDPVAGSIRTKTGKYTGCSALSITTANLTIPGLCDLVSERINFAPGVGPVMVQSQQGRLYLLVETHVGGILIGGQ